MASPGCAAKSWTVTRSPAGSLSSGIAARPRCKILTYDSQGFWLAQKRLSRGRFRWWPTHASHAAASLDAHQLQRLIMGGDPAARDAAPVWRRVPTG